MVAYYILTVNIDEATIKILRFNVVFYQNLYHRAMLEIFKIYDKKFD